MTATPADVGEQTRHRTRRSRRDTLIRVRGRRSKFNDTEQTRYSVRYTLKRGEWEIYVVNEVRDWIASLDDVAHARVVQAIDALADAGPGLGRPLVDTIHGSVLANLKELRPGTVRILFAFDPWRSSILLVAGDKAGQWISWYR